MPDAAAVKVVMAKVRFADRSPPPVSGAVVEMVRVVGTPPRAVSAAAAVVAPVPPLAMATGITREIVPLATIGLGEAVSPAPALTLVTVPVPAPPPPPARGTQPFWPISLVP